MFSQIRSTRSKSLGDQWLSMVFVINSGKDLLIYHYVVLRHISNMGRIRKQGNHWRSIVSHK